VFTISENNISDNNEDWTKSGENEQSKSNAGDSEKLSENNSNLVVKREIIEYIELEIGLLKVLDVFAEDPLEMAFQDKLIKAYSEKIFDRFLGNFNIAEEGEANELELDVKRREEENLEEREQIEETKKGEKRSSAKSNESLTHFKGNKEFLVKEYERLNIMQSINELKSKTEEFARSKGITQSYAKKSRNINLYTMIAFISILLAINFIPGLQQYYMIVFLILMPVMCFLPQYLVQSIQKKWRLFKEENYPIIKSELGPYIQNLKNFNQLLIDDCINVCIDNKIPLQMLQLDLYYANYDGLNIEREIQTKNGIKYICTFQYPEGVEPFEVPATISLSQSQSSRKEVSSVATSDVEVSNDHENDLFILTRTEYESGSKIPQFKEIAYSEPLTHKKIEEVLQNSEFYKVREPSIVFNAIKNTPTIKCKCGSNLEAMELDLIKNKDYPNFEFLFVINKKCSNCGANPFMIIQKKDTAIPKELEDIFLK